MFEQRAKVNKLKTPLWLRLLLGLWPIAIVVICVAVVYLFSKIQDVAVRECLLALFALWCVWPSERRDSR